MLVSVSRSQQISHYGDDIEGDLLRAALILTVAAMDAYFTSRFTENLVPFLKTVSGSGNSQIPSDLISLLNKGGLDTKAALEMLTMKRPYRRIRTIVDAHLSSYTTQQDHVIDKLFLCYGVMNLSSNAEAKAGRTKLVSSVRKAVLRRNQIAHDGDLNQRNRTRSIREVEVTKWINDIDLYVKSCEGLIKVVIDSNMKKHSRVRRQDVARSKRK